MGRGRKKKNEFLGFHCHPEPGSRESILSDYLGQQNSKKDAMLEAVLAYWLPLALEDAGVSGRELEKVGMESVCALRAQIDLICALLNLDRARLGLSGGMVLQQAPSTTAAGNGSDGDGGSQKRKETSGERFMREVREQLPNAPEYTHGSGFEDW